MIEVEKVGLFRVKKDDQVTHLTEEEARELFQELSKHFWPVPVSQPWTVTYCAEGQGFKPNGQVTR